MKINGTLRRKVATMLSILAFIIQSPIVKANKEVGSIDFSNFSAYDRPVAIKLWQIYGLNCIGKWIVVSEHEDGTKEEIRISYGPGGFSKMINEKIVNMTCVYARVSRRTYMPLIGDYIYD